VILRNNRFRIPLSRSAVSPRGVLDDVDQAPQRRRHRTAMSKAAASRTAIAHHEVRRDAVATDRPFWETPLTGRATAPRET
jgi:hypothetical protein